MFIYSRCKCAVKPKEFKFTDTQLTSIEERLKLIAVKARIQILLLLADSSHCVCDIVAHTGFSQSLVSHHLADLMAASLVENKKDGNFVEYFLNDNGRELLKAIEHVSNSRNGNTSDDCNCDDTKKKCCNGEETKQNES